MTSVSDRETTIPAHDRTILARNLTDPTVTSQFQLVTSQSQLVTSQFQLVTSQFQPVTSQFQLVTSVSAVTSQSMTVTSVPAVTSESRLVTPQARRMRGVQRLEAAAGPGEALATEAGGRRRLLRPTPDRASVLAQNVRPAVALAAHGTRGVAAVPGAVVGQPLRAGQHRAAAGLRTRVPCEPTGPRSRSRHGETARDDRGARPRRRLGRRGSTGGVGLG